VRNSQALDDPVHGQAAALKQLRLLAYREAQDQIEWSRRREAADAGGRKA